MSSSRKFAIRDSLRSGTRWRFPRLPLQSAQFGMRRLRSQPSVFTRSSGGQIDPAWRMPKRDTCLHTSSRQSARNGRREPLGVAWCCRIREFRQAYTQTIAAPLRELPTRKHEHRAESAGEQHKTLGRPRSLRSFGRVHGWMCVARVLRIIFGSSLFLSGRLGKSPHFQLAARCTLLRRRGSMANMFGCFFQV